MSEAQPDPDQSRYEVAADENGAAEPTAQADVEAAEAAPLDGSPPPEGDNVATLTRERDELKDRLLRTMADYQNYARRSQQNITEARQQALGDLARALLTVMDHFDRALEVDPEKTPTASVLQGVQIVHDELVRTLERFDIKLMEVKAGDEFDPARHEALMHEKVEGAEPHKVARVLQPGYLIDDKTLRPAKVSITS
ncbi:MAG: nucleotide exchange factor GrpE [Phycisphaeraceae bacterium]